jgi:hypothetical protein
MHRLLTWSTGRTGAIVVLVALASALAGAGGASAQATPPTRVYGTATIDGVLAGPGTAVQAFVNGVDCGDAVVSSGGNYSIDVVSGVSRPGCAYDGAQVTFAVAGLAADQVVFFSTGTFINLNLTAHSLPPAPLPPAHFYGLVYFNGQPLPAPAVIGAFIGATSCGVGGVAAGGGYSIDVASSAVTAGCGVPGAVVQFRIGGALTAQETGVFAGGAFTALDLHFVTSTPPPSSVLQRGIPGRARLDPGESVRFSDDPSSRGSRSARVINASGDTIRVSDRGDTMTIIAPEGTGLYAVDPRGADCRPPFAGSNILQCRLDRRARITVTTHP